MASRGGSRKGKRPLSSYLDAARALSPYAPSLNKYKRRKTLSPAEKGAITRKAKLLRHTENLIPVSKEMARELKDFLYTPERYDPKTQTYTPVFNSGIKAIRLSNAGADVKIFKRAGKALRGKKTERGFVIETNGRRWIYEAVPQERDNKRANKAAMKEAGALAFRSPEQLGSFEGVVELAKRALKRKQTRSIALWTAAGRVGANFEDFGTFLRWLDSEWMRYKETDRWVYGIAVRLRG